MPFEESIIDEDSVFNELEFDPSVSEFYFGSIINDRSEMLFYRNDAFLKIFEKSNEDNVADCECPLKRAQRYATDNPKVIEHFGSGLLKPRYVYGYNNVLFADRGTTVSETLDPDTLDLNIVCIREVEIYTDFCKHCDEEERCLPGVPMCRGCFKKPQCVISSMFGTHWSNLPNEMQGIVTEFYKTNVCPVVAFIEKWKKLEPLKNSLLRITINDEFFAYYNTCATENIRGPRDTMPMGRDYIELGDGLRVFIKMND